MQESQIVESVRSFVLTFFSATQIAEQAENIVWNDWNA